MKRRLPNTAHRTTHQLRIQTLGRFRVEIDGVPRSFGVRGPRKPLEMLKCLAAAGGKAIPKARLADLLWPDADGDQAHWAFSTTLHRLRKLLPPGALRFRNGLLAFDETTCWVDTIAFRALAPQALGAAAQAPAQAARQALEAAVSLYGGPFLAEEVEPSPAITVARDQLHDLYVRVVQQLGDLYRDQGDQDLERSLYRTALDLSPQTELFYQRLMQCYLAQGRLAEGVAVYHRCRRALLVGLGSEPSRETAAVLQGLLAAQKQTPLRDDKVSLAILPFRSLNAAEDGKYFVDGIAWDLGTALVKLSNLLLVNHGTAYSYRDSSSPVAEIGAELGVGYVLEGAVRCEGQQVRVSTQLTDVATGQLAWAERFEGTGADLFAVQDEITDAIVAALEVRLVGGEAARLRRQTVRTPEARDVFYRAIDHFDRYTVADLELARQGFEAMIRLEPDCPLGYAYLGWCHWLGASWNPGGDRHDRLEQAESLAERSMALKSTLGIEYALRGNIRLLRGEHVAAVADCTLAVEMRPSCGSTQVHMANVLAYSGRPKEAIVRVRHAIDMSPLYPPWFLLVLAHAYLLTGQHAEARDAAREFIRTNPDSLDAWVLRVAATAGLRQQDELDACLAEFGALAAAFSARDYVESRPYDSRQSAERLLKLLEAAGVK